MVESEFGFFNRHGLIPPFFSSPAYGGSPYKIGLRQFVNDFSIGCSRFDRYKRISILEGYLAYRKMLHGADICSGIQWVNGSFVTYKELIEQEAPNDIDVVSIIKLPEGDNQESYMAKHPQLFDHGKIHSNLCVDANYIMIESLEVNVPWLLERANYWNNLWSHQKETLHWKGYFWIDLSPEEDAGAQEELDRIKKRS
ncbi:MAG TPA: hypothetical protein GXX77_08470 [Candidatus Cloacimonetes bacterium]|nr:hypothetical protein [Candidatus Cloacimonadota bacterium]